MKKLRNNSGKRRARHAVCTVSAAALMLGACEAATIGFNFQTHYCGAASYSGAVITGTAFGIGTNGWESLSQLDTGYNGCAAGYLSLSQTIDTTSSTDGLNPLPNGALSLNWSGYTANVSGFGGYSRSGPHYTFGGNGYNPGNEQVYWGFIRDGVNFGPGSSGGDNNQPGYVVDITGLKSVFTNTPFAVQVIASSDSLQYLTNVFIIDATASTTQSVVYPSIPTVGNVGDTAWVRGIGGGLSTGSGSANTDHLKIIGNRAAHNAAAGNWASTIAGFIITDKPVISMSPNSVLAAGGDSIQLAGYAVGVPPLTYQWRKDGAAVPGATSSSLLISTNVAVANGGNYVLVVTNLYGAATSSVASVIVDKLSLTSGHGYVLDSSTSGSEHDGTASNATWLASSLDAAGTNRAGVMRFQSATAGQIVVPSATNFNSKAGTISFWLRSAGVANPSGASAIILDRRSGTGPDGNNGLLVELSTTGNIIAESDHDSLIAVSTSSVADNKWHLITILYDQGNNNESDIYVDGVMDAGFTSSANWSWGAPQPIEIGKSHDPLWQAFDGQLDDIRFYDRPLTSSEITSLRNTGAVIDAASLVLRLNFDAAPIDGTTLYWQAQDVTLQSADSITGPWTDVPSASSPYATASQTSKKFYRYHGHTATALVSNPYLM